MARRVLQPQSLTVLTTSRCTAACRHCNMSSGPDRSDTLSWDQLRDALEQWFVEAPPERVVFAGGEPTLLGDVLVRAVALCSERGVATRVVTNGWFASSPEAARSVLAPLRAAGLDELNISTDDFHLPWISLQRVRHAYDAAVELDFAAVVIATCYGPSSPMTVERLGPAFGFEAADDDSVEDRVGFGVGGREQERVRWRGQTALMVSGGATQAIGRGRSALTDSELLPPPPAGQLASLGGCPWAVRSPAISPRGHLLACCGFELEDNPILDFGSLEETPLAALLDRADADLIANMIALIGPPRIREVLEEHWPDEVRFSGPYRSYCEVCSDLVNDPVNRQALYRHQHQFVHSVVRHRDALGVEPD